MVVDEAVHYQHLQRQGSRLAAEGRGSGGKALVAAVPGDAGSDTLRTETVDDVAAEPDEGGTKVEAAGRNKAAGEVAHEALPPTASRRRNQVGRAIGMVMVPVDDADGGVGQDRRDRSGGGRTKAMAAL